MNSLDSQFEPSCFGTPTPAGRANGWLLASHVEVLLAAHHHNATDVEDFVRPILRAQAEALCAVQAADGRFHQVLNETRTFRETSVTALTVWSLATATTTGDLDHQNFGSCLGRAWQGLAAQVAPDGSVAGICQGGPIKPTVASYNQCATSYVASACGGLGMVLRATAAMAALQQAQGEAI